MTVKLLTEHHLEFLSLKGACIGLAEPTLIKMPHCWKSAHIYIYLNAKVSQPLNICVFFSMFQVRIFI